MKLKVIIGIVLTLFLIGISVQATVSAEISVGVKEGDWIEYNVVLTGTPPYSPYPTTIKIEILSVQGTNVTLNGTLKSDGIQETITITVDLETDTPDGFIVPANLNNGDTFYDNGGYITISGVEKRTYAGVSRSVVYTTYSEDNVTGTFYWDKTTGVLVEASQSGVNYTMSVKVSKTNMWQAQPFGLPIDPTLFYVLIIVAIVIVATVAFFMIRRRKKLPEEISPPPAPPPPPSQQVLEIT